MKHAITLIAISGFLLSAGFVVSQDVKPGQPASPQNDELSTVTRKQRDENIWMKAKQKHAHSIFDGLTEGDFTKVEEGAKSMYGSGILERWMGRRPETDRHEYDGQANALDYSLKELVRHSQKKDVDGAMTAYVMMSQACVRCHTLIRDHNDDPR